MADTQQIRRIITGKDEQGKSYISEDNVVKNIVHPITGVNDFAFINLWRTESIPASLNVGDGINNQSIPLAPSPNGVHFRYVDFPPDDQYLHLVNQNHMEQAFNSLNAKEALKQVRKPPHPMMHVTKTLDFGIVLFGEIYLILDKEEKLLSAGDVVIQRGTNHAWSNRSGSLCRMIFILIDAK